MGGKRNGLGWQAPRGERWEKAFHRHQRFGDVRNHEQNYIHLKTFLNVMVYMLRSHPPEHQSIRKKV